jgi:hypothetical protein
MANEHHANEGRNREWGKNLRLGKKNQAAGKSGKNKHYIVRPA